MNKLSYLQNKFSKIFIFFNFIILIFTFSIISPIVKAENSAKTGENIPGLGESIGAKDNTEDNQNNNNLPEQETTDNSKNIISEYSQEEDGSYKYDVKFEKGLEEKIIRTDKCEMIDKFVIQGTENSEIEVIFNTKEPTNVEVPFNENDQVFEVCEIKINNLENLEKMTLYSQIQTSWIDDTGIDPNAINLYIQINEENKWESKTTESITNSDTYYFYKTELTNDQINSQATYAIGNLTDETQGQTQSIQETIENNNLTLPVICCCLILCILIIGLIIYIIGSRKQKSN